MATVQDLMSLIGRMEGWGISNSVATRNNNPGNLKYAGQAGAIEADSRGYAIFSGPDAGMVALQRQIELDASRGLSVREFVYKYAPPSENNSSGYLGFITNSLGVGADERLSSVVGSGSDSQFVSGFDDTEGINLGTYDLSYNRDSNGGSGVVVLLGAAVLGIILYES